MSAIMTRRHSFFSDKLINPFLLSWQIINKPFRIKETFSSLPRAHFIVCRFWLLLLAAELKIIDEFWTSSCFPLFCIVLSSGNNVAVLNPYGVFQRLPGICCPDIRDNYFLASSPLPLLSCGYIWQKQHEWVVFTFYLTFWFESMTISLFRF